MTRSDRRILPTILLVALLAGVSLSCSSQKQFKLKPVITEEDDRQSVPKPDEQEINLYQDGVENAIGREIKDFANLSLHIPKLANNPKEALNINAFGEVPNSSWFTNRHAVQRMSIEELKRGPNKGTGPDQEGPWTVIGAKAEGVSPGFTIRDSRGDVYFIKFDIKGFPQLNTAAEVISTKFIYAAGYNTPENYLGTLDPQKLKIADNVKIKNQWGRKIPMTFEHVQEILQKVQPNPDGTYRVVASKRLTGTPVGPFEYTGTRDDDPNDHIPHNKRRELRGYKVLSAWLNNDDAKANNTLDMYVEEDSRKYVKHYLIDFATSLGSSGFGAAQRDRGHRGGFDLGNILKKIFSLGLWVEGWEKEPMLISPSVGYFESRLFEPGDYAQLMPNPAFQRATNVDGFWAAKIVMSFSDEEIRAIVETGEFANQSDADYIAKTLIERRDKTGRYWYSKVNPLDHFQLVESSNGAAGGMVVQFEDLAVRDGFEKSSESLYRYRLESKGRALSSYEESSESRLILTPELRQAIQRVFTKVQPASEDDRILTLRVETKRGGGGWSRFVKVHFYYPEPGDDHVGAQIVAVEREDG